MALTTHSGKLIPELQFKAHHFIDKTTVLYGPSKTGKTVYVKHIMKILQPHIEQILVVAPSEPSNRSYEGFVHPTLIHYRLWLADKQKKNDNKGAERFLEAIWQRQTMMSSIYSRVNNIDMLKTLYHKLPIDIQQKENKNIAKVECLKAEQKDQKKEEKITSLYQQLLKKIIIQNIHMYKNLCLTEDEKFTLNYINLNPRLLLILDDCAAELHPLFTKEIFKKFFYQNRHCFISMIICCQDDTDLPANLRKNAFVSIFTNASICMSNFSRQSNRYSKQDKEYVEEISHIVFKGYRKLVYIREDEHRQHFYHSTVPLPTAFSFGSKALLKLCKAVYSKEVVIDKSNPYWSKFRLNF
ncbi:B354L [African swine fever virus]|nr:B354L [African swine fever virus]